MAANPSMQGLLEVPGFATLAPASQEKFKDVFKSLSEQLDCKVVELERYKLDAEQRCLDLDRELQEVKSDSDRRCHGSEKATSRLQELEKEKDGLREQLSKLRSDHDYVTTEKRKREVSLAQTKNSVQDMSIMLERKKREYDALNEEKANLNTRLMEVTGARLQALAKADELENDALSLQYREKRHTQEKGILEQQLENSNRQLSETLEAFNQLKREQSTSWTSLQADLAMRVEEVSHLQSVLEEQRAANKALVTKEQGYIEKLEEQHKEMTDAELMFNKELQAQKKLTQLYSVSADEAKSKMDELTAALAQLREVNMGLNKDQDEGLREKDAAIAHAQVYLAEKDEEIRRLVSELASANDLIGQQKEVDLSIDPSSQFLSPSVTATSRLLKRGLSLTQIYHEYVQASNELALEQESNKRLTQYVEQIMKEIEEKAPILARQREDYEQAITTIDLLRAQMEDSLIKCTQDQMLADDLKVENERLKREDTRLQYSNTDLSLQVRTLLRELEQARGGRLVPEDPMTTPAPGLHGDSDAMVVITENLVKFGSVSELQSQNQRLMVALRELSEERELDERKSAADRKQEVDEALRGVQAEVDTLREQRGRQQELVEALINQRDMYKTLLAQSGPDSSHQQIIGSPLKGTPRRGDLTPQRNSALATSTPGGPLTPGADMLYSGVVPPGYVPAADVAAKEAALSELQKAFGDYKTEKQEHNELLKKELSTVQEGLSESRVARSKVTARLEFSNERFQILSSNAESSKREVDSLRDRNSKYTVLLAKHEETISALRHEILSIQERVAKAEARCDTLSREKENVKSSEATLLSQIESMRKERSMQSVLLTNLQSIQNNLERSDYESKAQYTNHIERLERERSVLVKKIEDLQDQLRAVSTSNQTSVGSVRIELERERASHKNALEDLSRAKVQLNTLRAQSEKDQSGSTSKTAQDTSAPGLLRSGRPGGPAIGQQLQGQLQQQAKRFQLTISQLEGDIGRLRGNLARSEQHADQYKTMAAELEKTLHEQNEASQKFKLELEKSFNESQTELKSLNEELKSAVAEKQSLLGEAVKVEERYHEQIDERDATILSLREEVERAQARHSEAANVELAARRDMEAQALLAKEAQEKYENVRMEHAADMATLTSLREMERAREQSVRTLQDKLSDARSQLTSSKTSWEDQEKRLKAELEKHDAHNKDLGQQATVLHEQIEMLTSQLLALQKRDEADDSITRPNTVQGSEAAAPGGEEATMKHFLEIIKFLRREKTLLETRTDVTDAELTRVKHKLQISERNLEETSQSLSQQRETVEASLQTTAQHAELLRRVEQMNILSDSNKLLREERDKALQSITSLENQLREASARVEPLQSEVRTAQIHIESLTEEKGSQEEQVTKWKAHAHQLIEKYQKGETGEVKLREEVNRSTNLINRLRNESRLAKLNLEKANQEISSLKSGNVGLNADLSSAQKAQMDSAKELNDIKGKITQKEKELQEAKVKAVKSDKEAQEARAKCSKAEQNFENIKARTARAEKFCRETKAKLDVSEKENGVLKPRVLKAEKEINEIRIKCARAEKESGELRAKLSKSDSGSGEGGQAAKGVAAATGVASVGGADSGAIKALEESKQTEKDLRATLSAKEKELEDLKAKNEMTVKNNNMLKRLALKYKHDSKNVVKDVSKGPVAVGKAESDSTQPEASSSGEPGGDESSLGLGSSEELENAKKAAEEAQKTAADAVKTASEQKEAAEEASRKVSELEAQLAESTNVKKRLTASAEELSMRVTTQNMLCTQQKERLCELEAAFNTASHNSEQYQRELTELRATYQAQGDTLMTQLAEIQSLQSILETQQRPAGTSVPSLRVSRQPQQPSQSAGGPSQAQQVMSGSMTEPPTANIRPMASPVIGLAAPVPSVSSSAAQTSSSTSTSAPSTSSSREGSGRMTASIRPMAQPAATLPPMATVMPTSVTGSSGQEVVSVAEGESQVLHVSVPGPSGVRPMQQVQLVSPHVGSTPVLAQQQQPMGIQPTQQPSQSTSSGVSLVPAVQLSHQEPTGSEGVEAPRGVKRSIAADSTEEDTNEPAMSDSKRVRIEAPVEIDSDEQMIILEEPQEDEESEIPAPSQEEDEGQMEEGEEEGRDQPDDTADGGDVAPTERQEEATDAVQEEEEAELDVESDDRHEEADGGPHETAGDHGNEEVTDRDANIEVDEPESDYEEEEGDTTVGGEEEALSTGGGSEEEEVHPTGRRPEEEEALSTGGGSEEEEALSTGGGLEEEEAHPTGRGAEEEEAPSTSRGPEEEEALSTGGGLEEEEAPSAGRDPEEQVLSTGGVAEEEEALSTGGGPEGEEVLFTRGGPEEEEELEEYEDSDEGGEREEEEEEEEGTGDEADMEGSVGSEEQDGEYDGEHMEYGREEYEEGEGEMEEEGGDAMSEGEEEEEEEDVVVVDSSSGEEEGGDAVAASSEEVASTSGAVPVQQQHQRPLPRQDHVIPQDGTGVMAGPAGFSGMDAGGIHARGTSGMVRGRGNPSVQLRMSAPARTHSMVGAHVFSTQMSTLGDNDGDGIVPSTPILQQPERAGDGFAEVVGSPYPGHPPFHFSAQLDASAGAHQLYSARMEDMIDVSGFSSQPTTPLQSAFSNAPVLTVPSTAAATLPPALGLSADTGATSGAGVIPVVRVSEGRAPAAGGDDLGSAEQTVPVSGTEMSQGTATGVGAGTMASPRTSPAPRSPAGGQAAASQRGGTARRSRGRGGLRRPNFNN